MAGGVPPVQRTRRAATLTDAEIEQILDQVPATAVRPRTIDRLGGGLTNVKVIGLYAAFAIPIWYRWRLGDSFTPGPWTLGNKYRWMSLVAVAEIAVTAIYFLFPTTPQGIPWHKTDGKSDFAWTAVNYTPIVVIGALVFLWIAWHVTAKHWFTGLKNTFSLPAGVSAADEIALEHEHHGYLTGEHE